jgi:hypothetical protein
MAPMDWMSGSAAIGMLVLSLAAVAVSQGAHRQRTDTIESVVKALGDRVTVVEALKISVEGLTRGTGHLGDRLADSQN